MRRGRRALASREPCGVRDQHVHDGAHRQPLSDVGTHQRNDLALCDDAADRLQHDRAGNVSRGEPRDEGDTEARLDERLDDAHVAEALADDHASPGLLFDRVQDALERVAVGNAEPRLVDEVARDQVRPGGEPVVDAEADVERLVARDAAGALVALDREGRPRWSRPAPPGAPPPGTLAPAVARGTVLLAGDGIAALDAATGELLAAIPGIAPVRMIVDAGLGVAALDADGLAAGWQVRTHLSVV